MVGWIRRTNRWLVERPLLAASILAGAAVIAFACYRLGLGMFVSDQDANLLGRAVAWPGGTAPAFAAGAVVLGLLLLPDGRLEGRWRRGIGVAVWWVALLFALFQLLDDHVFGHAGTDTPIVVAIPYPIQDLAELPMIGFLLVALAVALITLPWRLGRRRAQA